MEWLSDSYAIQAGDAAAAWASRGYSVTRRRWETLAGINMPGASGGASRYKVRCVEVRLKHQSNGRYASGVRILIATIGDPVQTQNLLPLTDAVQSVSGFVRWIGEAPMGAGVLWKIALGGTSAINTDLVEISVGYEGGW